MKPAFAVAAGNRFIMAGRFVSVARPERQNVSLCRTLLALDALRRRGVLSDAGDQQLRALTEKAREAARAAGFDAKGAGVDALHAAALCSALGVDSPNDDDIVRMAQALQSGGAPSFAPIAQSRQALEADRDKGDALCNKMAQAAQPGASGAAVADARAAYETLLQMAQRHNVVRTTERPSPSALCALFGAHVIAMIGREPGLLERLPLELFARIIAMLGPPGTPSLAQLAAVSRTSNELTSTAAYLESDGVARASAMRVACALTALLWHRKQYDGRPHHGLIDAVLFGVEGVLPVVGDRQRGYRVAVASAPKVAGLWRVTLNAREGRFSFALRRQMAYDVAPDPRQSPTKRPWDAAVRVDDLERGLVQLADMVHATMARNGSFGLRCGERTFDGRRGAYSGLSALMGADPMRPLDDLVEERIYGKGPSVEPFEGYHDLVVHLLRVGYEKETEVGSVEQAMIHPASFVSAPMNDPVEASLKWGQTLAARERATEDAYALSDAVRRLMKTLWNPVPPKLCAVVTAYNAFAGENSMAGPMLVAPSDLSEATLLNPPPAAARRPSPKVAAAMRAAVEHCHAVIRQHGATARKKVLRDAADADIDQRYRR